MIPTVEQIFTQVAEMFADPNKRIFKTAVCQAAFNVAWEELFAGLLEAEAKYIQKEATYTLPANTTSLTPATAGISDFGELTREIEERPAGSTLLYVAMSEVDELSQRPAVPSLLEYTWREDKWFFIGATQDTDLKIPYMRTSAAPTTGTTGIDGCYNFLWARTAAVAGLPRGFSEDAKGFDRDARGPNLDFTQGYLHDLIAPMMRSLQRTPVQPRAYSADWRRRRGVRRPYLMPQ